jgi:UDP-galactopyranose mutase
MTRFARDRAVIYWEEPVLDDAAKAPSMTVVVCPDSGVRVATPVLPHGLDEDQTTLALKTLVEGYMADAAGDLILWYYTPMMLRF